MSVAHLRFCLSLMLLASSQVLASAQLFLSSEDAAAQSPATAHFLTMGWSPSPDTSIAGYYVCYGLTSGSCTNQLNVGNSTTATFGGIQEGVTYFFRAVAYDASGQKSPPSSTVAFSLPILPPPPTNDAPQLTLEDLGTGAFRIQGNDPKQRSHRIQFITNAGSTNWQTLGSVTPDATGAFEFVDVTGSAQRDYRAILVQATARSIPAPVMQPQQAVAGGVVLTWSTVSGQTYRLQYRNGPTDATWHDMYASIVATGRFLSVTNFTADSPQRFYRTVTP